MWACAGEREAEVHDVRNSQECRAQGPACPVAGLSSYMVVMGMVMCVPSRQAVPTGRLLRPSSAALGA